MNPVRLPYFALLLAAATLAACRSSDDAAASPDGAPLGVGPAPLRRLSNGEYLNAIHDLFPDQTPTLPTLPNDSSSSGFENATDAQEPSDVRIARYEAIANLYAAGATRDAAAVRALVGCPDWSTPALGVACIGTFLDGTASRVFRRPLTAEERDRFTLHFQAWNSAIDFEAAAQLTLSALLQSPQFLYRPELSTGAEPAAAIVTVEPYAMASRLSFFLWESGPDDMLLQAAASDALHTEDQIRAHAERMVKDDRARRALWSFHRQWLGLDRILGDEHLVRTPAVDSKWTAATPAAIHLESELFVENVLMQGGTLHDLLTSRRAWVNGEMARIYGTGAPPDPAAWQEVSLPEDERAGILTRAAFLAGYSHRGATSPPIRGNAIEQHLLCQLPISPPPGVDLSMPKAAPNQGPQTNRMLFEARTAPATCQTCHYGLNGFGFGLESYSAAGAFQTHEVGLPIDPSGRIVGTDVDRTFSGGIDLSSALETSDVVRKCVTKEWLTYALGRAPTQDEAPLMQWLAKGFGESGGDIKHLLVDIVTSPTFRMRRVTGS